MLPAVIHAVAVLSTKLESRVTVTVSAYQVPAAPAPGRVTRRSFRNTS